MVNISVKELIGDFNSKEVNLAQVSTDDGRTFSVSISLKIEEKSSKQSGIVAKSFCVHSPVECDTSGCMNSSPDSERSGILNPSEFVGNGACNVDDFLNHFDDTSFPLDPQPSIATVNEGVIDEGECESIADSDSTDVEYFVIDELVGKRFNDKTQKCEFLLRPKRCIPTNDIIWNPIDNTDNFDVSLLEHGRLYIEVPDSLKKHERRERSVLQDKLLSEVNISSGQKIDYLSSAAEVRNSSVCRKLDTSMGMYPGLKFDELYSPYLCTGSSENTMDVEMGTISSSFKELAPVVPALVDPSQAIFEEVEQPKKKGNSRQRAEKKVYRCADCDFAVTVKKKIMQHVRQHLTQPSKRNTVRRCKSVNARVTNRSSKQPRKMCHKKMKRVSESNVPQVTQPTKSNDDDVNIEVSAQKQSEDVRIELDENGPENTPEVISNQRSDDTENTSVKLLEDCANQTDENSTKTFCPVEVESLTDSVRPKAKRGRKKKNAPIESPKSDQSFNGKPTRRRRSNNDNQETKNTQSGQKLKKPRKTSFVDGDCVTSDTKILDSLPNEKVGLNGSTRIAIPVQILLQSLYDAGVDVEMLKKRQQSKCASTEESPSKRECEGAVQTLSSTEEGTSSRSSGANTESMEGTCPGQSGIMLEALPSASSSCTNIQTTSDLLTEDDSTDQEVISSVMNGIINMLDAELEEKSQNSFAEDNFDCESQLSSSEVDTSKAGSSTKSGPRFKCRFCNFIAVGNVTYRKHVIKSHVDKFKQCLFCGRSFMGESSLEQHRLVKHAEYFPNIVLPRLTFPTASTS